MLALTSVLGIYIILKDHIFEKTNYVGSMFRIQFTIDERTCKFNFNNSLFLF